MTDLKKLAEAAKAADDAAKSIPSPAVHGPAGDAPFKQRFLSLRALLRAVTPDAILDLYRERDEAREENTRLRAALAISKDPCVYCQLPAEDMARCRAGFPGCARMDDISGCPEFGAMMEIAGLQDALATLAGYGAGFSPEAPEDLKVAVPLAELRALAGYLRPTPADDDAPPQETPDGELF